MNHASSELPLITVEEMETFLWSRNRSVIDSYNMTNTFLSHRQKYLHRWRRCMWNFKCTWQKVSETHQFCGCRIRTCPCGAVKYIKWNNLPQDKRTVQQEAWRNWNTSSTTPIELDNKKRLQICCFGPRQGKDNGKWPTCHFITKLAWVYIHSWWTLLLNYCHCQVLQAKGKQWCVNANALYVLYKSCYRKVQ